MRRKHEWLEKHSGVDEHEAAVAKEIAGQEFIKLAAQVRELKTSLVDFVFVDVGDTKETP
jgi:hypothetical protein